ncbi:hypothetical protein ACQCN2_21120 [Brevibacillus ginsengisoli]|uniref:hypothetical protein n=1 Tax=Brevibacillus ginsengisoli TaxID=363854 RepID=UPI003CEB119D
MIRYVFLIVAASFVFLSVLTFILFLTKASSNMPKQKRGTRLWVLWKRLIPSEDEKWSAFLSKAGKPFGWGKAEWLGLQIGVGGVLFLFTVGWLQMTGFSNLAMFWLILIPSGGYFMPYLGLRWWANYREEILSVDIARFINRYVNLLENHVPPYFAMVKAARPTKLLKNYIPSLSEWNRNKIEVLDQFRRDLGVDDAVILVSNMRTVEQLSSDVMAFTMQRLEFMVDKRRMFRHRKKIKSLGIGYSLIVYPAFYIGLIVAMFPWYKLLSEILDKYLV